MSAAPTRRADTDALLRTLWEEHKDEVHKQLGVIGQALAAAEAAELDDDLLKRAAGEAHKLAGSIGTLGFTAGSERARELELALAAGVPAPGARAALTGALRALNDELFTEDGDRAATASGEPARADPHIDLSHCETLDLLVVGNDGTRAQGIIAEADGRGLEACLAADHASAHELLAMRSPAIVLLDLSLSGGVEATLRLLSEAAQDRAVLVVTDPRQSVDRVEVARRGGRGFVPRSLTAAATIDAVVSLRQRVRPIGTRILALDDDPLMLAAIGVAVDGAGFDLKTCGDPQQFWEQLEEHEPDLVMLDFDMPGITGPELCRALRNDERWQGTPVLFLTSRSSAASIHEIFDAGADDYVHKPFVGPELVARIGNRLERVRLYRHLADVDALTGTSNRRKPVEDIERLLRMAARAQQPLTLCVLDIDHFKSINDEHGHPTGDAVLRSLGTALKGFLRGDDVIARWGGDEFVIGMYGMSGNDGRQRLAELLEQIRDARFGPHGAVGATLSAGLAEYPTDGTNLESLYRLADTALYVSKKEGGDRVVHRASRCAGTLDAILVVHDVLQGQGIERALHTRGYRTGWMTDADEAAEVLAGEAAVVAPLMLLDADLPGLGAGGLMSLLRQGGKLAHTRTILLGAEVLETNDVRRPGEGEVERVAKPLDLPGLMRLIRRPPVPDPSATEGNGGPQAPR